MRAAHQIQKWIAETETAIERHEGSEEPQVLAAVADATGRIEGMKMALGEIEVDRVKANNLLDTLNMVIRENGEQIETLNRIIARYANGWEPIVGKHAFNAWTDPYCVREPEPMSDAEAAALRPHLETP